MRYRITGADRITGQDTTQTFDAKSPDEAESIASLSMLVWQVVPESPNPGLAAVTYATALKPDRAAGIDWAAGIALQARFLRTLSWPLAVLAGWYLFLGLRDLLTSTLYFGVTSLTSIIRDFDASRITAGILLLAAAALLRLVAHAGLAVSSFATRAPPAPNWEKSR